MQDDIIPPGLKLNLLMRAFRFNISIQNTSFKGGTRAIEGSSSAMEVLIKFPVIKRAGNQIGHNAQDLMDEA